MDGPDAAPEADNLLDSIPPDLAETPSTQELFSGEPAAAPPPPPPPPPHEPPHELSPPPEVHEPPPPPPPPEVVTPASPASTRSGGPGSLTVLSPSATSGGAGMTTPRPASEAALAQWLEDIGLADAPGLLEALSRGAGSLSALRSMPDEAIQAAVSPLQLRSLKQRKLNAALIALRSPQKVAALESPEEAPADEPPSRPRKPVPTVTHGPGRVGSRASLGTGPSLAMPASAAGLPQESAELHELACLLGSKGGASTRGAAQESKRESNVAELAAAKAATAAEDERQQRQEATTISTRWVDGFSYELAQGG